MNEFRWLFVDLQVRCRPKSEARRGGPGFISSSSFIYYMKNP